jgi:hypothetical protein
VYLTGAEAGEIFEGTISASPISDLTPVSSRSAVHSYPVTTGQTIVNLGREYEVGLNVGEMVGSIAVYDGSGNLKHRGVHYNEIDSGNGTGITIELITPPVSDTNYVVFFGNITIADHNAIGMLESLSQGIIAMAKDLSTLVNEPLSKYTNANPSAVERRVFGDKVLKNESDIADLQSTFATFNATGATKWQVKTDATVYTTSGTIAGLAFNNLTVGNTYRVSLKGILSCNAGADTTVAVEHDVQTVARIFLDTGGTDFAQAQISDFGVFVATVPTTSLVITCSGSSSITAIAVLLEELPNHQVTTDWT